MLGEELIKCDDGGCGRLVFTQQFGFSMHFVVRLMVDSRKQFVISRDRYSMAAIKRAVIDTKGNCNSFHSDVDVNGLTHRSLGGKR